MEWSKLKAIEKARVIKLALDNGVSDINTIRDTYNIYSKGGKISIDPSKKGTFTAAAKKHGMGVQEFASRVLANKENYSPAIVKKANFARNAAHWHEGESDTQYLNTIGSFLPNIEQASQQVVQHNLGVDTPEYQRLVQEALRKVQQQRIAEQNARQLATSEIATIVTPKGTQRVYNPGAGYISGTDPLLQAIIDMTPAGDAEMAAEATSELGKGNLKEAGILGAALLLPNIFNKGIKEWRASKSISDALNNGVKNSNLQTSAFDKGVLSGKIGWAPSQDISWRHGSNNPDLKKFVPYDRWDVVNRGASPYEYFVTEMSSPLNMMDERPFQYYGSLTAKKPIIQLGEFNLNGKKNATRNELLKEGWKRGADTFILKNIGDNKALNQTVIVRPVGAEGVPIKGGYSQADVSAGLLSVPGTTGNKTLDFSYSGFNKDILKDLETKQYQEYLRTGKLWENSLTPIPSEHLGITRQGIPDNIRTEFNNTVFPRMIINRPWLDKEDFIRKANARLGNEYSLYPGETIDRVYPSKKVEGVYYPSTDRVMAKIGKESALSHEFRHKLDAGIELTDDEISLLEKAFGKDFINMQGMETSSMFDEMVTTNLDARNKLLGDVHTQKTSVDLQNKIIDKKTDEQIVEALSHSNGYGKKLVAILKETNQLTPERIQAFREAMKKVGVVSVPLAVGVSSINADNNKYSTGGPLYPFSFIQIPTVRY